MNIVSTLNDELLKQPFVDDQNEDAILVKGQQVAFHYSQIENSIAVLSDLKANKSYVYYGGVSDILGITERGTVKNINSIWEQDIFDRIHPDDLAEKHLLELRFFYLLKTTSVDERSNYHIVSKMRMADSSGRYIAMHHRMFYVCSCSSGNLWLALCLYNFSYDSSISGISKGVIINSANGNIIRQDEDVYDSILSSREREVLQLIEKGETSESIASVLYISKNTVSRHRQNILEKLRVKNSVEACRIAKLMNLI